MKWCFIVIIAAGGAWRAAVITGVLMIYGCVDDGGERSAPVRFPGCALGHSGCNMPVILEYVNDKMVVSRVMNAPTKVERNPYLDHRDFKGKHGSN